MRRSPLRRVPMRHAYRSTGPDRKTRARVLARDEGFCVRCGFNIVANNAWYEIQHRRPRGMGGGRDANRLSNLILLCVRCHRWVEKKGRETQESYDFGFLVHRWEDPATWPVACARRGRIVLDDGGGWRRLLLD